MKIQVTQDDIDHGKKRSCSGCPIGRAIARATGKDCLVGQSSVKLGKTWFRTPEERWLVLPDIASMFIRRFDDGEKVEPFEFEVA